MRNLIRRTAARHAAFFGTSAFLLAGFQFLICAVVSTVNVGNVLGQVLASLPMPLRAMASERLVPGFTAHGLLAFGWNHPIAQALGCALAILLAARSIAGEIGDGTMELLLAQPISRRRYLVGQSVVALGALALLAAAGALGTAAGTLVFGLERFPGRELPELALSFFLLQSAWFGIALAVSAWGRGGGTAANTGFLLAVASFVLEVIGRLWTPAARWLPLSLYHYYAPQDILVEGRFGPGFPLVLAAVALAGIVAAAVRFERRDIP